MRILLILLVMFFSYFNVYGDNTLNIVLSDDNITLDDAFELEVILSVDNIYTGAIDFQGIKNFDIFSSENSNEYSDINGDIKNIQKLKLGLTPKNTGKITIGPASIKIGNNIIKSNILQLHIVNNLLKKEKIIKKIKDENFDGNNIKGIKIKYNIFQKNHFFQFIFILFFLFLIYVIYNYFKQNKVEKNIDKIIIPTKNDRIKVIIKELKKLSKDNNNLSKDDFFEKLNLIFRKYFFIKGIKDSDTLTFLELEKTNLPENILSLFKKSYFNEFNKKNKQISPDEGLLLIDKFINILKK